MYSFVFKDESSDEEDYVAAVSKILEKAAHKKKRPRKRTKESGSSSRIVIAPHRDMYGCVEAMSKPRKRKHKDNTDLSDLEKDQPSNASALPIQDCSHDIRMGEDMDGKASVFEKAKQDLEMFLAQIDGDYDESPAPTKQYLSHSERKKKTEEDWSEMRPFMHSMFFKKLGNLGSGLVCFQCCQEENARAVIGCNECGTSFCPSCDTKMHKQVDYSWHNRKRYDQGYSQPIEPCCTLESTPSGEYEVVVTQERYVEIYYPGKCRNCGKDAFTSIPYVPCAYITMKGRVNLYLPKFMCSGCLTPRTVTSKDIITSGLMPGSCQVSSGMYIFHPEVLQTYYFLKMESPLLSRRSFVSSLDQLSLLNGCKNPIFPHSFKTAYNEWLYCQHAFQQFTGHDWMTCPGCHLHTHSVHLDGNKKLYCFKGHNQTSKTNHFGDIFIANDDDVDEFVKKIQRTSTQSDGPACGETHWKAARSSSKRQKSLLETGLEVGCCRHGVLLKALNMFRGEIFACPLYLHQELHSTCELDFLCQDVICKYWPWMEKVISKLPGDSSLQKLLSTKPFLSVFHAKAHDWTCQVIWGGRWQEQSASQAGEEMEQANSYLSRAALTTKTMDKAGREEQLTAHAVYWNRKKIESLHMSLCHRYKRSRKKVQEFEKTLSDTLVKEGIEGATDFKEWKLEVQEFANDVKRRTKKRSNSDFDQTSLESLQHELEVLCSSIRDFKYDVGKRGDSGQNRQHIRERVEKERKKMLTVVALYNEKAPHVLKADEITSEHYIFPWHRSSSTDIAKKRKVVDIVEHIARHEEEGPILLKEMESLVWYYRKKVRFLHERLSEDTNSDGEKDDIIEVGKKMVLLEAKVNAEVLLKESADVFRNVLSKTDVELFEEFEEHDFFNECTTDSEREEEEEDEDEEEDEEAEELLFSSPIKDCEILL